METIYIIKMRSNRSILPLYESERRYSASKVLGLAVVHLSLAIFALICTSLTLVIISNFTKAPIINSTITNNTSETEEDYELNLTSTYDNNLQLDLDNLPFAFNITTAGILLFLASLISSIGGFMAWKRWYVDSNIKWFFMTTCVSILLSSISTALVTWTMVILNFYQCLKKDTSAFQPFYHISVNILIASVLGLIWSIVSTIVAYNGMNSPYQDDICEKDFKRKSNLAKDVKSKDEDELDQKKIMRCYSTDLGTC